MGWILAVIGCGTSTVAPPAEPPRPPEVPVAPPASGVPASARVFFVAPADGATIASPVVVSLGVQDAELRAAGAPGARYLWVGADTPAPPVGQGVPPVDATHVALTSGGTEVALTLPPGPHTLVVQLVDEAGASLGPQVAASIQITVQ